MREMGWRNWFRQGDELDAEDIVVLLAEVDRVPAGGIWATEVQRATDAGVVLTGTLEDARAALEELLTEA